MKPQKCSNSIKFILNPLFLGMDNDICLQNIVVHIGKGTGGTFYSSYFDNSNQRIFVGRLQKVMFN
jgi:hypothetical protein